MRPRLLLVAGLLAAVSMPARAAVTVGRLKADLGGGGLLLSYDSIPVFKGSLLQVFAPNPSESFSSGGSAPAVRTEALAGGGRALVADYRDPGLSLLAAMVQPTPVGAHPGHPVCCRGPCGCAEAGGRDGRGRLTGYRFRRSHLVMSR